jgi:hypothetical protein
MQMPGKPAYSLSIEQEEVVNKMVKCIQNLTYPFGMHIPGRSFSSGSYRYGFGSQEKDDKISGIGNSYTAKYWQYDSRLGRRWNTDPIIYPWQSTYTTFNNNPIVFNDPLGLYGEKKAKRKRKRAVKRYGEDRVTDVYYNKEKDEYGFGVVNDPTKNKNTYRTVGGVMAYRTTGIYSNKGFRKFDYNQAAGSDKTQNEGDVSLSGTLLSIGGVGGGVGGAKAFGAEKLFGGVLNNFKGLQAQSNTYKWGLNYGREGAKAVNLLKWSQRIGTGFTWLGAGVAVTQFAVSDQSAGDYTRLGMNTLIFGLTVTPEPFTTGVGIGLGLMEAGGMFNGLYNYTDLVQQTGIMVLPTPLELGYLE